MTGVCDVTNTHGCGWQQTVNLLFDKFISFVSSRVNWADSGAYLCTHITHHYRICFRRCRCYQKCFFPQAFLASNSFWHSRSSIIPFTRRLFDMLISSMQLEIMIGIKYRRFTVWGMAMAERCASRRVSAHVWYVDTWCLIDGNSQAKNYRIHICIKETKCVNAVATVSEIVVCGAKPLYLIYLWPES